MARLRYARQTINNWCPKPIISIAQERSQTTNRTQEIGFSWNFACNPAQFHRTALVDPHQQPDEVDNNSETKNITFDINATSGMESLNLTPAEMANSGTHNYSVTISESGTLEHCERQERTVSP